MLTPAEARRLLSKIMRDGGQIIITGHARHEMLADQIEEIRLFEVLRYGQIYEAAEYEREAWRYRVHRADLCVVVEFDEETAAVVITTWRKL